MHDLWFRIAPHIPEHVAPWWYYLCVGLAVFITGMTKAGFGGGAGIMAIPVMTLAMPSTHMLGVMLPLLLACDVLSNLHYIGQQDWKRLTPLLIGAVIGVLIGTAILIHLRDMPPKEFNSATTFLVGFICMAVVALQLYRLTGREPPTLPPHPASAGLVGLVAGTLSTINHSAGPIVTVYLLQEKLEKRLLVGTLLLYFLLINSAKLPTYVWLGYINRSTLHDSLWFIPLIPVGTLAGAWMHDRVPEKPFAAFMYIATAATAAYMVAKGAGWVA